jgi:hypothetical protein
MNTKTKSVGRPAAKLVYPDGSFTVKELYALNKRRVKWDLSIRQHIEKGIAHRWISKNITTLQNGNVGKPAHVYSLTKWGQAKLNIKHSTKPIEIPLTETAENIANEAVVTPVAIESFVPII